MIFPETPSPNLARNPKFPKIEKSTKKNRFMYLGVCMWYLIRKKDIFINICFLLSFEVYSYAVDTMACAKACAKMGAKADTTSDRADITVRIIK